MEDVRRVEEVAMVLEGVDVVTTSLTVDLSQSILSMYAVSHFNVDNRSRFPKSLMTNSHDLNFYFRFIGIHPFQIHFICLIDIVTHTSSIVLYSYVPSLLLPFPL